MIKVVYNELIGHIPDKLISWSKLISYWGCGANLEELSPHQYVALVFLILKYFPVVLNVQIFNIARLTELNELSVHCENDFHSYKPKVFSSRQGQS